MKKRGIMRKKRAQITIFIIIGIILLLSAILVVYLTTKRISRPIEEAIVVPEDVKPVHEFITNCLDQVSARGIHLQGQQAGYLYMPAAIAKTPSAHISLDPGGYFMIPFWYYEGEDRTPSLQFMEEELRKYIYDNIRACIGDFESFKEQYDIKEEGDIMPLVFFTENEVIARMKWPLELTVQGRTTSFEDFAARLPVKVKNAWEIADRIMKTENEETFFEGLTIELMSMDTNVPMDDMRFECQQRRWHLDDIKQRVQNVLFYNLPLARVENTNHIPFLAKEGVYDDLKDEREKIQRDRAAGKDPKFPDWAPPDAFEYWRMMMRTGQPKTDLRVSFDYLPQWGMRFNGKPNSGGVLKSNTGGKGGRFLRFFCMNQWHFTYDVIYPIRVTIKDDTAFAGQGYIFQFAFPVIINSNKPERVWFGIKQFRPARVGTIEFCDELGDTEADIRATGFTEASPIETELDGVNMTLRCFQEECLLGTTRADDGYYRLRTLVPARCVNPSILAVKEGYMTNLGVLSGNQLSIPLKKLKELEYHVIVHPYNSDAKTYNEPRELRDNEEVIISLNLLGGVLDQYLNYPTGYNYLELVEETSTYSLDLVLNRLDNTIGGYHNDNLTIKYSDMGDADIIELHVLEYQPVPISDKLKQEMYGVLYDPAAQYKEDLKPTFKIR